MPRAARWNPRELQRSQQQQRLKLKVLKKLMEAEERAADSPQVKSASEGQAEKLETVTVVVTPDAEAPEAESTVIEAAKFDRLALEPTVEEAPVACEIPVVEEQEKAIVPADFKPVPAITEDAASAITEETSFALEAQEEETPMGKSAVEGEELSLWGIPLLPEGDERTDVILLEFLRARDFNVSLAFEELQKAIMRRQTLEAEELKKAIMWQQTLKAEELLERGISTYVEEIFFDEDLVSDFDQVTKKPFTPGHNRYASITTPDLQEFTLLTRPEPDIHQR